MCGTAGSSIHIVETSFFGRKDLLLATIRDVEPFFYPSIHLINLFRHFLYHIWVCLFFNRKKTTTQLSMLASTIQYLWLFSHHPPSYFFLLFYYRKCQRLCLLFLHLTWYSDCVWKHKLRINTWQGGANKSALEYL